jgi:glycosyltransferase involved in cell wall biosynthesis
MFGNADFIVAACEYLHRSAIFPESLPRERTTVILDGVEDNYVAGIPAKSLPGDFRSGRCHRLVRGKFRLQSIKRIEQLSLPRHKHYILGFSEPAKAVCRTTQSCVYVGPVVDRLEKIAHLKSFHVYYYETYMHEGPGMALLESLACGVPAVCLNWGGITEVIKDKVNGLVLNDTNKITESLRLLQQSPDLLSQLSKGATADFQDRLHVRHTASKYAQLFEHIL